jgi:hypothetical protein
MLTLQTTVPAIPEADVAGFLAIEAERGFPYGPDALMIAVSPLRLPGGETLATQLAAPRDHLTRLERVLRAARLIPESFSLGLPALQDCESQPATTVALDAGENGVGLQIAAGRGLVTLRTLDNALETEGAEKRIDAGIVARELRITLGQLPPSVRAEAKTLRIFGASEQATRLAGELRPLLEPMGLAVERVARLDPVEIGVGLPPDAGATMALALGARHLAGRSSRLQFLPPKVSAWRQMTARYSSRKLAYGGMVAGAVLLIILFAFLIQQFQLMQLRSEWAGMSARVRELDGIQKQIRQYRPWFDDTFRSLSILRRLTEAFPEEGTVTAKTIEIHDSSPVTCVGTANDQQELMKMIDRLRGVSEISEVQMDQIRGKSPLQFTFNFQWGGRNQP